MLAGAVAVVGAGDAAAGVDVDVVDAVAGVAVVDAVDDVDVVDEVIRFPFENLHSRTSQQGVLLNVPAMWPDQEKGSGLNSSWKYLFLKRFTKYIKYE